MPTLQARRPAVLATRSHPTVLVRVAQFWYGSEYVARTKEATPARYSCSRVMSCVTCCWTRVPFRIPTRALSCALCAFPGDFFEFARVMKVHRVFYLRALMRNSASVLLPLLPVAGLITWNLGLTECNKY